MRNKKVALFLTVILLSSFIFSGCARIENLKVKFGMKNTDFEYIKQNKIQKIIIQSTRDTGFKFIVTDKRAMNDLYDILSSAKVVQQKTDLEPDYVFEFYEGADKVHRFSYVVGIQKKGLGNFYGDNKSYVVSTRVDNDIIKNLSTLRKPRAFEDLYYDVILNFLDKYGNTLPKDKKVGINVSDDVEVAKYILSTDIEYFKINLDNKMNNAALVNKNKEDFDILISVKTYGYKTKVYKSTITVYNKADNSEIKYYAMCKYDDKSWNIDISTERQKDF